MAPLGKDPEETLRPRGRPFGWRKRPEAKKILPKGGKYFASRSPHLWPGVIADGFFLASSIFLEFRAAFCEDLDSVITGLQRQAFGLESTA